MTTVSEQPFTPGIAVTISAAASATRAVLDAELEKFGIEFSDWITLVTLWNAHVAQDEPADPIGALVTTLARALGADERAAVARLTQLESAGLVAGTDLPGGFHLTERGEHVFRTLRERIARRSTTTLAGIADEDVATTQRVLRQITERSLASLAA